MLSRCWLAASIVIVLTACGPAAAPPPEPAIETTDQQAIYGLGLVIAQRIEAFSLSEAELAIFERGLRDGVLEREKKVDTTKIDALIQTLANQRSTARAQEEKTESAAYLAKLATEPGASTAPTGYVLRTLTEGTGASPKATDTVVVHYHGTLRDGTVFDSSVDRGTPAEFPLSGVIPCWTQALQTMKVGGKYKLACPSEIAYGDRGYPPTIQPGATLTFDLELIEVKAPSAPESEPPEKP